jgi:energy-coupling factor transporter ATP-binding protein EcfA2
MNAQTQNGHAKNSESTENNSHSNGPVRPHRHLTALEARRNGNKSDRRAKLADELKRQSTLVPPKVVETDFTELEDGSLVEMIEDHENPSRSLLAVYKDGDVHYTDQLQVEGRTFVPILRDSEIVRHVRLPLGAKPYESTRALLLNIISIISKCIELKASDCILLAHFVLSTWFIDRLPVAPYVALLGPPGSGKTTLLRILRLLCRRSLLTADITSAAFYSAYDRIIPTLLIDETGSAGERRELFHLLRTGATRDVLALRKDRSFNAYGAKVVSWTELPNDPALNSRCIIIPLHETDRTDLTRPTDPKIAHAADEVQKQLLRFRFDRYRVPALPRISGDERLHSRSRDLYEALAFPCGGETSICELLVLMIEFQQESNREPLPPAQAAVLQTLFMWIHRPPGKGSYPIGALTKVVNFDLQLAHESLRLSPRQVGAALTSLGFMNRTRTNIGWYAWFDLESQKRIHHLVHRYGIENNKLLPPREFCKHCDFCKDYMDLRDCNLEPTKREPCGPSSENTGDS